MSKSKFDGVIEAVHYTPDGRVAWVRAYLRRGPTFSDRVMLDRAALIDDLKSGKKYMAGRRIELQASTFELASPIQVAQCNGDEILVTGDRQADRDRLEGVPVI
jgi:hypothetical protein